MENLQGVWRLEYSENFDNYLKELGYGKVIRAAAAKITPKQTIEVNGNTIKIIDEYTKTFPVFVTEATLNIEFVENTADRRTTKTTFTMEGNKLLQTQRWNSKEMRIYRYINSKGKMQMDLVYGNVKCARVHVKERSNSFKAKRNSMGAGGRTSVREKLASVKRRRSSARRK